MPKFLAVIIQKCNSVEMMLVSTTAEQLWADIKSAYHDAGRECLGPQSRHRCKPERGFKNGPRSNFFLTTL